MKTLLFQGDSITDCGRAATGGAGYPAVNLGPGYPGLIASRLFKDHPQKWNILNRGISGNRVVDLYARWKIDCINLKPDVLSILIGINDTWHEMWKNGVEPARYDEFYRRLLDWCLESNPAMMFVLLEPFALCFGAVKEDWLPEIAARQKIVAKIAKDYRKNAVFVPIQKELNKAAKASSPDYWLVDGVHPTPAGHQLIADLWLKAFSK